MNDQESSYGTLCWIDVSLKETSICVVDGTGEIVSEGTVISEPAEIAAFIKEKG